MGLILCQRCRPQEGDPHPQQHTTTMIKTTDPLCHPRPRLDKVTMTMATIKIQTTKMIGTEGHPNTAGLLNTDKIGDLHLSTMLHHNIPITTHPRKIRLRHLRKTLTYRPRRCPPLKLMTITNSFSCLNVLHKHVSQNYNANFLFRMQLFLLLLTVVSANSFSNFRCRCLCPPLKNFEPAAQGKNLTIFQNNEFFSLFRRQRNSRSYNLHKP